MATEGSNEYEDAIKSVLSKTVRQLQPTSVYKTLLNLTPDEKRAWEKAKLTLLFHCCHCNILLSFTVLYGKYPKGIAHRKECGHTPLLGTCKVQPCNMFAVFKGSNNSKAPALPRIWYIDPDQEGFRLDPNPPVLTLRDRDPLTLEDYLLTKIIKTSDDRKQAAEDFIKRRRANRLAAAQQPAQSQLQAPQAPQQQGYGSAYSQQTARPDVPQFQSPYLSQQGPSGPQQAQAASRFEQHQPPPGRQRTYQNPASGLSQGSASHHGQAYDPDANLDLYEDPREESVRRGNQRSRQQSHGGPSSSGRMGPPPVPGTSRQNTSGSTTSLGGSQRGGRSLNPQTQPAQTQSRGQSSSAASAAGQQGTQGQQRPAQSRRSSSVMSIDSLHDRDQRLRSRISIESLTHESPQAQARAQAQAQPQQGQTQSGGQSSTGAGQAYGHPASRRPHNSDNLYPTLLPKENWVKDSDADIAVTLNKMSLYHPQVPLRTQKQTSGNSPQQRAAPGEPAKSSAPKQTKSGNQAASTTKQSRQAQPKQGQPVQRKQSLQVEPKKEPENQPKGKGKKKS